MRKLFNIILFFLVCSLCFSQNKETLTIHLLEKAKSFSDIEKVLDIIQAQPDIYKYVPSIQPIAPKDKPYITSNFGMRFHPIDKVNRLHSGIDFKAEFAASIHATASGTVDFVERKGGYGKTVVIRHKYGFISLYGHLTEYYVKDGQKVEKGDIIAFLGNTGKSTGAHLHFEVRKNEIAINPKQFINN